MWKTISSKGIYLFFFVVVACGFARPTGEAALPTAKVALSQPLTIRWRYGSHLTVDLTPAYDGDRIYLPLAGGTLVSLQAKDGQLNWLAEMGGELSASPVADDRGVYVASEIEEETGKLEAGVRRATGTVRVVGREGGVTLWMRTLAGPLRGALTISGNILLAAGGDGRVYAFDRVTGEIEWSVYSGGSFNCWPVVSAGLVYVGNEDGSLLVLEETTGKILWRYRTKGPVRGPVAVVNGAVYFGSGDGYVYAVNSANRRLLWRKRTGAAVQAVAHVEDALLVASLDNFVYRFSLNGARVWKRQLPGRIASQPLTATDGALFTPLASLAGVVLGLRDGRQINSLPTGEEITRSASPIAIGDAVLLTTEHGLLAFAQPRVSQESVSR